MKIPVEKQELKSLLIMGAIVEARDPYTGGHLWRVTRYSGLLASKIGLSSEEIMRAEIGGFLHDLGKVGVPDAILRKPAGLTEEEFEVIKTHPSIGANLIGEHPLAPLARDPIHHHHERVNGQGYPHRLQGDEITPHSKIVGIADAFDAMTSTRSYRTRMLIKDAVSAMAREHDRQFEGKMLDQFLEMAQRGELDRIVGHTDENVPLVDCPHCGPVIAVSRQTKDGDIICCKVCTRELRLHGKGETFEAEKTGRYGSAAQLQPEADMGPIVDLAGKMLKKVSGHI